MATVSQSGVCEGTAQEAAASPSAAMAQAQSNRLIVRGLRSATMRTCTKPAIAVTNGAPGTGEEGDGAS